MSLQEALMLVKTEPVSDAEDPLQLHLPSESEASVTLKQDVDAGDVRPRCSSQCHPANTALELEPLDMKCEPDCDQYETVAESHGLDSEELSAGVAAVKKAVVFFDICSATKRFRCEQCGFCCNEIRTLADHIRNHPVVKYKCPECSYTSARSSNVRTHVRIHVKEKPFSCDVCEYRGKCKYALAHHLRTHAEPMLRCDRCRYRTRSSANLTAHVLVHTASDVFTLDQTVYNAILRRRVRVNTTEK